MMVICDSIKEKLFTYPRGTNFHNEIDDDSNNNNNNNIIIIINNTDNNIINNNNNNDINKLIKGKSK